MTNGGASYQYSKAGALKYKIEGPDTTRFTYDVIGNLLAVRRPDGRQISYVLDGANRRIATAIDGSIVRSWVYDGPTRLAAELDGHGAIVSRFVFGTNDRVPDLLLRGGRTYRMITDHLGSVRLVVDAQSGAIVQRIDYDEFGVVLLDSNPGFQPFGFAGGLYDAETGLVRFGVRDYDARVGRWTARDPFAFDGGSTNLYLYAEGDPVNVIDPTGRETAADLNASFVVNGLMASAAIVALQTVIVHGHELAEAR